MFLPASCSGTSRRRRPSPKPAGSLERAARIIADRVTTETPDYEALLAADFHLWTEGNDSGESHMRHSPSHRVAKSRVRPQRFFVHTGNVAERTVPPQIEVQKSQ